MTTLVLHVQPGARRAGLRGWRSDGSLKLAVVARPEQGKANEEVKQVLAEALAVAPRALQLARGAASRHKWIEIDGLSAEEVRRRIDQALADERENA